MKEINIARVLVSKRHEKGLTQDDIADFIGVSKASVSKWETGQSYPDVTLLPRLAAFFGISIDALMDYQPQLTKEEIRKLYLHLSADFASKPFAEVLADFRQNVKKYYACWPLLVQMGILLLNHASLAKDPSEVAALIREAGTLFRRARLESEDAELRRQAAYMEALSCLSSGDPDGALALLGEKAAPALPPESLIAAAYRMQGKNEEAKTILQAGIFQNLVTLFNFLPAYLAMSTDEPARFNETFRRALQVSEIFDLRRLHPALVLSFFAVAAQSFMEMGEIERALEALEHYTDTVTGDIYPLKLHGDAYFNLLDSWFSDLDLGTDLPRNEKTVRRSMADAVSKNPAFSALSGLPRFTRILEKLEENC